MYTCSTFSCARGDCEASSRATSEVVRLTPPSTSAATMMDAQRSDSRRCSSSPSASGCGGAAGEEAAAASGRHATSPALPGPAISQRIEWSVWLYGTGMHMAMMVATADGDSEPMRSTPRSSSPELARSGEAARVTCSDVQCKKCESCR